LYVVAKDEGVVKGNYKGIVAAIARESVYRTLAIGLYEPIKRELAGDVPANKVPTWKKFASGALAGMIGSTAGNPLDILKVRQQGGGVGDFRPMRYHAKDIYQNQGGIMGFYRGLTPSVMRAVVLNAIYMGNYDTMKHAIINRGILPEGLSC